MVSKILPQANKSATSVTVVAIIRLVAIYKLFYVPPDPNKDPFYDIGVVYNTVEVNLAIVSASAPALRPMFRKWWPKLFGAISSGKTGSSGLKYYGNSSRPRNTVREGDNITLKDMRMTRSQHHTEIRSTSPSGSEEEIMTYNGIVRTTNVNLTYESNTSVGDDSRSSTDYRTGEKPLSKGAIV